MKTWNVNTLKTATMLGLMALVAGQATMARAQTNDIPASGAAPKNIKVIDDIAYRPGASKAWRLDLAMPENFGDERHPALVIVHGGGWRAGSKRDRPYRTMLMDYALKGYVTISVDYRLTGEAPFPACIEDVKCAVRWLRAHAAEYHVDPDRIGTYGHSAGAHLSLMLAMCPSSAGLEGDGGWNEFSSGVTAAVTASTPVRARGTGPDADKWSPITYVSSNTPPLLLIHGTADTTVPIAGVEGFVEAMTKIGHPDMTYMRVTNANHGVAYEHYLEPTRNAMDKFFDRTLKKK